MDLAPMRAGPA